jgi:hypothetical protein
MPEKYLVKTYHFMYLYNVQFVHTLYIIVNSLKFAVKSSEIIIFQYTYEYRHVHVCISSVIVSFQNKT